MKERLDRLKIDEVNVEDGKGDVIHERHRGWAFFIDPNQLRAIQGAPPFLELSTLAYSFIRELKDEGRPASRDRRFVLFAGDHPHPRGKTSVLMLSDVDTRVRDDLSKLAGRYLHGVEGSFLNLWETNLCPIVRYSAGKLIGYFGVAELENMECPIIPEGVHEWDDIEIRLCAVAPRDTENLDDNGPIISWKPDFTASEIAAPGFWEDLDEDDDDNEDEEHEEFGALSVTAPRPPVGQPDRFGDLRPPFVEKVISLPDPALPGASLPEEAFEEMYNHFGFGYETFHTLDVDGKVWLLFLEEDPDQCQLQLNARWEVTCAPWHTMGVLLTINIFDNLEEPLEVDYHFDLDSVDEAHEAVQLVDQATIPVCIVTPGEDDLQLFGSREITLPPELKDELVELITAGLRRRQLDDEAEGDEEGDEDEEVS